MEYFTLAWRNIWRNKRRTFITMASIFFGVFLCTLMGSMQEGTYGRMIENVTSFYSGYIQIHHPEYWETKSIDHLYTNSEGFKTKVSLSEGVEAVVPRLESFGLLSFKNATKGSMVIGIHPAKEDELTGLKKWVEQGTYLKDNDDGILVAKNVAKSLSVQVGDTLAIISQGYHGVSASGLFPVKGIISFPIPAMNNFGTYISLPKAQDLFRAEGLISSTVIKVKAYDKVAETKQNIVSVLDSSYAVMTWDEMDPITKQMIESDKGQGVIMKGILYVLIGFGIFSTVIMMVAERKKELAIMISIGMKKQRLALLIFIETLYIGLMGLLMGFVISLPFMLYLVNHPIPITGDSVEIYESFGMEPAVFFGTGISVFTDQVGIIVLITLLVSVYPVLKIVNLNVTKALHA